MPIDPFLDSIGSTLKEMPAKRVSWYDDIVRKSHKQAQQKNKNYGNSVAQFPCLARNVNPATGCLVRMSDKVNRISNLLRGDIDLVGEALEDTWLDLANYCILYQIIFDWTWQRELEQPEEMPADLMPKMLDEKYLGLLTAKQMPLGVFMGGYNPAVMMNSPYEATKSGLLYTCEFLKQANGRFRGNIVARFLFSLWAEVTELELKQ